MDKTQLIELLLKCPSIKDAKKRQVVVSELPHYIRESVENSDNSKEHVLNIVNACVNFDKGIAELISAIRFFDEETIPFQTLVQMTNEEQIETQELQGQPVKSGNLLMRQKNILIILSLLGLLILLVLFITINLIKGGNTVKIDIDGNQQGPIHIEQGNSYGISPDRFSQLSEDLGVTKVALRNFFKITEKKQVSLYDLDNTLREIAKHYKELMAKVATLNSDDPEVAKLIEQAKQAIENGDFDQAEQFFNQASDLDIKAAQQAQEIANKRFVSAAESLAANGDLKMTQLAYRESGEYYEKAAKLLPVGNDGVLALYLNYAGMAFDDAALYDKAKSLYERALAIHEKIHGKEHPDVATSLNNLALLHKTQGHYDQAKPLFERSLAIDEKVYGPDHPDVATDLNNLASLHRTQGNYDQAKPLYERSLAILEKVHGKEHPHVATSLNNLAELHRTQGNYDQAKPLYERSLAIWEKVHGEEHPLVATSLNNLAELHRTQGNYDQAKPLYERSLAIWEKVHGDEHPLVATSLNNLAMLYEAQSEYNKAKPLYERSLKIFKQFLGNDHPNVKIITKNYNDLLSKMAEQ
jgi:tetratricopeptide (TPR) repeat protein